MSHHMDVQELRIIALGLSWLEFVTTNRNQIQWRHRLKDSETRANGKSEGKWKSRCKLVFSSKLWFPVEFINPFTSPTFRLGSLLYINCWRWQCRVEPGMWHAVWWRNRIFKKRFVFSAAVGNYRVCQKHQRRLPDVLQR